MGLNANVMCNCFRDGMTTPPPFPPEWLVVDNEGYLNLTTDYDSDDNWRKHYEWAQSCCEHEGMNFVSEYISNWSGYRLFQEALGEVGWQHFPVLKEQLPNANGGLTPSAASLRALSELSIFTAVSKIGTKTVLVDTASGEVLHEYVGAYQGCILFSARRGINVGLSESDFLAVDAISGEELFRATRFRQFNKSGGNVTADSDGLTWENMETGKVYESGLAISGKQLPWDDGSWQKPNGLCRFEYPAEFHVEQRPRLVSDFDDIVKALRAVFDGSARTGNPVRWC